MAAHKRSPAASGAAARWWVDEQDGAAIIVRDVLGNLVLVEHDGTRWVCSQCGAQPSRVTMTCLHTVAAAQSLPREVAAKIASAITSTRNTRLKAEFQPVEERGGRTAREATVRVDRHAARDAEFRRIVSPVTTRTVTDEDRQRLLEMRRRKRRLVGAPDPV